MDLSSRTVLDQVEVQANGTLQIRLIKEVRNGNMLISKEYHRTVVEPGVDVDAQFAQVEQHLQQMGFPGLSEADITKVKALVQTVQTPEVIQAFQDQRTPPEG